MKRMVVIFLIIFNLTSFSILAQNPNGTGDGISENIEFATLPKCKVTLNGKVVDSQNRLYPFLQFRDIVYFPMTYHDCRFLGLTTQWDDASKKLTITKDNTDKCQYYDYIGEENLEKFMYGNSDNIYGGITDCTFDIEVNGKKIANTSERYPLLLFRDITYFPLTWRFAVEEFGWEYSYSDDEGLIINSETETNNSFKIIGYYSGDLFDEPLSNLQTDKLTHIMYAFLIPKADGSVVPFKNPDKIKALVEKAHSDGCKVYIAVGGWSYENIPLSPIFETVSADDSLRAEFIRNILDVTDVFGFDGVELDWEYPSAYSMMNYEKLILELDEKLSLKGKHITAALNGAWSKTEGPEVSNYVSEKCLDAFEFINVMSYDMNNEQHSPLWFADTSVEYWLNRGVESEKIVLGMPLYARPTWMQYRHLVGINPEFAYVDSATVDGVVSHYNGLDTLSKKTLLAKEKAGGVMLFDVNEDTNDEYSVVTMIDKLINQVPDN